MKKIYDQGRFNIGYRNFPREHWYDYYHRLLKLSWSKLFLLFTLFYFVVNTLFALLYMIDPKNLNQSHGTFMEAFFFSVQTFSTVGYGTLSPATTMANFIVMMEVISGTLTIALMTGLFFAKFSLPTAKVIFCKKALISPYNQIPTFMFRFANARGNQIFNVSMYVDLIINMVSSDGVLMRRLLPLSLIRNHTPLLALSWTAMHPITSESPLFGLDTQKLIALEAELVVNVTGTDGTQGQPIHALHTYALDEIIWGGKFRNIIIYGENGDRILDFAHFHEVETSL